MKSLGSSLAGAPSAVSFKTSTHLDVCAVVPGNSGNKIRNWHWDGATWQEQDLPAGPAIPAEGICAISSEPNIIDVFAASPDGNNTPWWWRWNGTVWLSYGPLPQGANLFPVPLAAVASGPTSIDVFAAGAGKTPWWWQWHQGAWIDPTPLPLPPGNIGIHPVRVAVVSPRPNRLDVFAADAQNHLLHWWREGASGWSVEDCGGNLPAEGVSVVSWGPNRIDVFAASRGSGQGPDGNPLQHWSWDGNQRGGPETLGGNLAIGTVSAVSPAPNRLEVFGIAGDGRLTRWRWDGSHWSGPNYLGGNMPAGDVSAVVHAPNRTAVFVRGPGNSLLQWPGSMLDNTTNQSWHNLAENWQVPSVTNFSPIAPVPPFGPLAGHCYPDSLEELVDIVQEAERLGRHVRAVGSSWSNSDVAVTPDYLVETHKLNGELASVLSADTGILQVPRGNLVHVEAGITLGELIILLDKRGLALPTLGGSSGQTLAGAISTSVHGADFRLAPIPDMVQAIHLVGAGGIQHWIEPSLGITNRVTLSRALGIADANIHQDDDWFNSALVSVGSLGIIYSLIINAVPQYDLVENCEWLTWTAVKARLQQGAPDNPFSDVAGNRAVNVIVNPFTGADGTRPCFLITRKEKPADKAYSEGWNLFNEWWLLQGLELAVRAPWELTPKLGLALSMHEFITGRTRDRYPERLSPLLTKKGWAHTITTAPGTPPLRGLSLEIAFNANNDAYLDFVDAACDILLTSYRDENLGLAGWFSMRFVGHSRAYLSPQNRFTRTCMVEIAGLQELSHTRKLLAKLEALGRQHGGIQHWGMFDDLTAADVARAYPKLDAWLHVRQQLTNNGAIDTFDNDFSKRCGLTALPVTGGQLWHNEQVAVGISAPWSDWHELSNPGNKAKVLTLAAHPDGRMHAVMTGLDDQIWHNEQVAVGISAPWSDWHELSNPGNKAKVLTLAAHPDGRMHAVMTGLDDQIWHNEQTAVGISAPWSDWHELSNPGNKAKVLTLAAHPDGRMHAVMTGLDDQIWHNEQVAIGVSAPWSDWHELSNPGNKAKVLTLAAHPDGRMHAVMTGLDDQIWHNEQVAVGISAPWSDWHELSNPGNKAKVLALAAHPDGYMHALMTGLDDQIWHNEQTAVGVSAPWSDWHELSNPGNKAKVLTLAAHPDGRMHAVMTGLDDQIWHNEQTSVGVAAPWSDWHELSNPGNKAKVLALAAHPDGYMHVAIVGNS